MTLKSVLTSIDVAPEANVEKELAQKTKEMLRVLQESARKEKLNVEFFVGGSFAKKTLVKKDFQ